MIIGYHGRNQLKKIYERTDLTKLGTVDRFVLRRPSFERESREDILRDPEYVTRKNQEDIAFYVNMYEMDTSSGILAEYASMFIVAGIRTAKYHIPYLVESPVETSLVTIYTDLLMQIVFEVISDIATLWILFQLLSMSPVEVFNFQRRKWLWAAFTATILAVTSYTLTIATECVTCTLWDSEVCFQMTPESVVAS